MNIQPFRNLFSERNDESDRQDKVKPPEKTRGQLEEEIE